MRHHSTLYSLDIAGHTFQPLFGDPFLHFHSYSNTLILGLSELLGRSFRYSFRTKDSHSAADALYPEYQ